MDEQKQIRHLGPPEFSEDRPTVLVVDDDRRILAAFELLIAQENCNLIIASDIEEAMQKCSGRKIDLLITDFYLETKSSVELYYLLRKKNPGLPIVVITGYPEYVGEYDVKLFGANYFFTKPLELNKIRNVIRECIKREEVEI